MSFNCVTKPPQSTKKQMLEMQDVWEIALKNVLWCRLALVQNVIERSYVIDEAWPIGSMYGIYTYIWLIFMVNVAKYTIHGYYGWLFETWFQ